MTESGNKSNPVSTMVVVKSALAAALGVQSAENRERDFQHGSPKAFIIAGLIFTVLFIGTVITVVSLVTP
jgi:hypothetical protein